MPLQLDYYYGGEAEQFSFYRIPKALFADARFKDVSVEAKVLYGLFLDRMALSVKNGWLDAEGRVYIIFTIADILGTLGCAEQKANRLLGELDTVKGVGLIERKRRGLGKPNIIYVKNFIDRTGMPEPGRTGKPQIKNCENHKSGNVKAANQELRLSQANNTYRNETDPSETDPSIHQAQGTPRADKCHGGRGADDGMDKELSFDSCRRLIQENIDYGILVERSPHIRERLDGLVELMAEVCCSRRRTVRINREDMRTELVRSRFLKLDSGHIEYVMDCLDSGTSSISNIRAYILSALFNAPVTISQYYASLVSHDMAAGGG